MKLTIRWEERLLDTYDGQEFVIKTQCKGTFHRHKVVMVSTSMPAERHTKHTKDTMSMLRSAAMAQIIKDNTPEE